MQKTQNRGGKFGASAIMGLFLLPRACENAVYVSEIYRKLGCGGAATTYLGIENGVIPNVVVQIATMFCHSRFNESPPSTCIVLIKYEKRKNR